MTGRNPTPPVIMWFRQDLRLGDNPALTAAAREGPILALYVLDDETPGPWRWGGASRWWLHHSLARLGEALAAKSVPLVLRRGRADEILAAIVAETAAASLHYTRDYAPWSPALEQRIAAAVTGTVIYRHGGALLYEPEDIRTGSGAPFKVFTPFARACRATAAPRAPLPLPRKLKGWNGSVRSDSLSNWKLPPSRPNWARGFEKQWTPGETGARRQLQRFAGEGLAAYAEDRDRPDRDGTSRLSPHLHWGEISPHQCWHAVSSAMAKVRGRNDRGGEKFLSELLWRDFCHHLLVQAPDLPEHPFRKNFGSFPWAGNAQSLTAWQAGRTGYPIVDAGMRELWSIGIMHNRVRMIVASFLIKHLLTDWRQGEAWFWDTLVDADLASNAANWQWVAGCGADASPYFRIFNPILQGEKFDPAGSYVRRWVPELKHLLEKYIHTPWKAPAGVLDKAGVVLGQTYPMPIVDHETARQKALTALKAMKGATP